MLTGKAGEGFRNPAFKRIDKIAETVQARLPGPRCLNGAGPTPTLDVGLLRYQVPYLPQDGRSSSAS